PYCGRRQATRLAKTTVPRRSSCSWVASAFCASSSMRDTIVCDTHYYKMRGMGVVGGAPLFAWLTGRGVDTWPGQARYRWSGSVGEIGDRRRSEAAAADEGEVADAEHQPERPNEKSPR